MKVRVSIVTGLQFLYNSNVLVVNEGNSKTCDGLIVFGDEELVLSVLSEVVVSFFVIGLSLMISSAFSISFSIFLLS